MSQKIESDRHIVVTATKSVGVSLILTILFGPLGMLYSTVGGGIFMIIVSVILALITAGFSLIITWPISVIWGAMAVSSTNKKLLKKVNNVSGYGVFLAQANLRKCWRGSTQPRASRVPKRTAGATHKQRDESILSANMLPAFYPNEALRTKEEFSDNTKHSNYNKPKWSTHAK